MDKYNFIKKVFDGPTARVYATYRIEHGDVEFTLIRKEKDIHHHMRCRTFTEFEAFMDELEAKLKSEGA